MDAAKADLMRALGRLARGMSTLFWCLPLTLVAQVATARTDWVGFLGAFAFVPALVFSGMVWNGLRKMRDFQKQERIWQQALDGAELLAIVNTGLTPFLFWWHRFPMVHFYAVCVDLLAASGILLLIQINRVLLRLSAILPDETLRVETRTFAGLNTWMLLIVLAGFGVDRIFHSLPTVPLLIGSFHWVLREAAVWVALFFGLMPVAMTLALVWKIKEAIFTSLFDTAN
jgi:hypothetical protein